MTRAQRTTIKFWRWLAILAILIAVCLLYKAYGQIPQSAYVTLTGRINAGNGLPAANYVLSFTPTQNFLIPSAGAVLQSPSSCFTSQDGNVVGLQNPQFAVQPVAQYAGTLPARNYSVRYAWFDSTGATTLPSASRSMQLTTTGSIYVSAPTNAPSSAMGFRVYIGTATGAETLQGSSTDASSPYIQSTPLVVGAAPASTNTTTCRQVANDAMLPIAAYKATLVDPNGNTVPGYPQQWQFIGPGSTINIGNGVPRWNGQVSYQLGGIGPPGCIVGQTCSSNLSPAMLAKDVYVYPTPGVDFGVTITQGFAVCAGHPCNVHIPAQMDTTTGGSSFSTTIHVPSGTAQRLFGHNSTLKYTGSGEALVVEAYNANVPSGGVYDLKIEGDGNTTATSIIHQYPRGNFEYRRVTVADYVGSSAVALLLDNTVVTATATNSWNSVAGTQVTAYSERSSIDITSSNNTKGLVFQQNGGTNSFARTDVEVTCDLTGGQACITARNGAFVYGTSMRTRGNGNGGNNRFLEILNNSTVRGFVNLDGEGGGYGYYVDGSSALQYTGAISYDTSQGNFNQAESSRVFNANLQGCYQAGIYNLGVAQARNSKFCLSVDGVNYYMARAFGGETNGPLTLWGRVTQTNDPESDGANKYTVFRADGRGYVGIGPGYDSTLASHMSGAPFEISVTGGQFYSFGLNTASWHTWYLDKTNKRWVDYYRGFDVNGQPSYPHCNVYASSGGGPDVLGMCETANSGGGGKATFPGTIQGAYTGTGNAAACFDTNGNLYRATGATCP